jgi:hypothetical protein
MASTTSPSVFSSHFNRLLRIGLDRNNSLRGNDGDFLRKNAMDRTPLSLADKQTDSYADLLIVKQLMQSGGDHPFAHLLQ